MILDIDVGNTLLKWRTVEAGVVQDHGRCPTKELTTAMPAQWPAQVERVRISNVAGPVVASLLLAYCKARWNCQPEFAVTCHQAAGVTNSYSDPSRMGVDRWLAMLAAYKDCNGACCVVDCGSAITVDYVEQDGQHRGGFIIPGLRLMSESLQSNTAEVLVDRTIEQFETAPGCHTSAAVAHGINFAFKALQEKLVRELEDDALDALYITGGDGVLFHQLAGVGQLHPDLVMEGLCWSLD